MGPIDAFWHLCNFLLPALVTTLLTTAACRVLWRRALGGLSWRTLLRPALIAALLAQTGALVLAGRDGSMLGHAALVLAVALALWWRAFGPGVSRSGAGAPPA